MDVTENIIEEETTFMTLQDARPILDSISLLMVEMKEGRNACGQLHNNLSLILSELDRLNDENRLPSKEIMNSFYNTLYNVQLYLKQYGNQNILSRRKNFEIMKTEMIDFIHDIDKLSKELNVQDLDNMEGWEEYWSNALATLCENKDAVLDEVLYIQANQQDYSNEMSNIKNILQRQINGLRWQFDTLKTMLIDILKTDLTSSYENYQQMTRTGSICLLMDLVNDETSDQKEEVAELFMNISLHFDHVKKFSDLMTMKKLFEWMRTGTDKQKEYTATAVKNLAQNSIEHRKLIVEAGGIDSLVEMLKSDINKHKLMASIALWILVDKDTNKTLIFEAGGLEVLTHIVVSDHDDHVVYAAEILWHLAKDYNYRQCMMFLGINPETGTLYVDGRGPPKRRRINSPSTTEYSV